VLRAPLGDYLPAALPRKTSSHAMANAALLAWTVAGVWLFLRLIADPDVPAPRRPLRGRGCAVRRGCHATAPMRAYRSELDCLLMSRGVV